MSRKQLDLFPEQKMNNQLPGYALHFLIISLQASYQTAEQGSDPFEQETTLGKDFNHLFG